MIDRDHLSAQTFGDADLAREVLTLFSEQCATLLPLMLDATLEPSLRADYAHTLRGAAAGIGAEAVARDCLVLEAALHRAGPLEDAVACLSASVNATVRTIAEWRP